MQIRAEEISAIIKEKIKGLDQQVDVKETGSVIQVGDGIAKVYGLDGAMAGEMLEFPGGLYGIALNLEEDNVGAVLMGDDVGIAINWVEAASRRFPSSKRRPSWRARRCRFRTRMFDHGRSDLTVSVR